MNTQNSKHSDISRTIRARMATVAAIGVIYPVAALGAAVIVFSDDFRTKNGPDLKVFLSKNTVSDATGRNATTNAIRRGVLKSNKGGQEYVLPEGVTLTDFSSVLVHCEAYSKLWGGADIS